MRSPRILGQVHNPPSVNVTPQLVAIPSKLTYKSADYSPVQLIPSTFIIITLVILVGTARDTLHQ